MASRSHRRQLNVKAGRPTAGWGQSRSRQRSAPRLLAWLFGRPARARDARALPLTISSARMQLHQIQKRFGEGDILQPLDPFTVQLPVAMPRSLPLRHSRVTPVDFCLFPEDRDDHGDRSVVGVPVDPSLSHALPGRARSHRWPETLGDDPAPPRLRPPPGPGRHQDYGWLRGGEFGGNGDQVTDLTASLRRVVGQRPGRCGDVDSLGSANSASSSARAWRSSYARPGQAQVATIKLGFAAGESFPPTGWSVDAVLIHRLILGRPRPISSRFPAHLHGTRAGQ